MRRSKKDVPVVTRFSVFLAFALVDGSASPPTSRPVCRLEFDIVAGERCPKATENFRQLITGGATVGEKRSARTATYKGTRLLRCTEDENFRQLITGGATVGEKRSARTATYKGTRLLRCTEDMIQCGDTANSADGKSQDTIFGAAIEDEALGVVPHAFGTLSLVNSGRGGTNGSQFAIVARECAPGEMPHLDARHVSLGFLKGGDEARQGLRSLHELAASLAVDAVGTLPRQGGGTHLVISECGVLE
jgi:cyclophilin family peptidyl-prolyl cis-trans isomerase